MVIPFYLGWVLLCAAFLSGAAEISARTVPGMDDLILSAYDLWHTLSPRSLVHAHIVVERNVGQWLWDPVLKTVLWLPAWVIFGVPGVALAWLCQPSRRFGPEELIDEETFFLIDTLSERAKEDGYYDHKEDRRLGHSLDQDISTHDAKDRPAKPDQVEHEDTLYLYDELEKAAFEARNDWDKDEEDR